MRNKRLRILAKSVTPDIRTVECAHTLGSLENVVFLVPQPKALASVCFSSAGAGPIILNTLVAREGPVG